MQGHWEAKILPNMKTEFSGTKLPIRLADYIQQHYGLSIIWDSITATHDAVLQIITKWNITCLNQDYISTLGCL